LILNKVEIGSVLVIQNSSFEKISLDDISGIKRQLQIQNTSISNGVHFVMDQLRLLRISVCSIGELKFSEENQDENNYVVEKSEVNKLIFENVLNKGLISLRELNRNIGGDISIISSDLGKTDFILCNFNSAKFEFENSKLANLFLAETDFPKRVVLNNKLNFSQAQLAFGQLRTAFQNQGDSVREMEYHSREIEAHYKRLSFYDKGSNKIGFTKISLWLNKLSNDFGRSWQKGLMFSICSGIIFFYLLVVSSKEYKIAFPINFDGRLFPAFLRFMNPLRFFELEAIFKFNQDKPFLSLVGRSYLFDFLGRIFVAYGFYQTIQAFRRFGRK
jgi:hypothetical protein